MLKSILLKPFLLSGAIAATLGAQLAIAALPTKDIPTKKSVGGSPADSIVVNTRLTNDTIWILNGYTMVKSGVTLTIDPGTTIQPSLTNRGTLMVDRGGYLVAAGTKAQPITFQCEKNSDGTPAERGQWGGIVMLGKARSNQQIGGGLLQYEALGWAKFGAKTTDLDPNNDSSGVLTYVRLDGPGFPIAVDRELNGITLCAVGRKTLIHHVQVDRGDDDGIEFFGGSANADHMVITNQTDDSYDVDQGYSGTIDYMIGIQRTEAPRLRDPGSTLPFEPVGDFGIECSSTSAPGIRPLNALHFSHITLIDNGGYDGAMEDKEECAGTFEKMVVVAGGAAKDKPSGWAFRITGDGTAANITSSPSSLTYSDVFLTGKWTELYTFLGLTGTPAQVAVQKALVTSILNTEIKNYPYDAVNSYGLYKDLTPSNTDIIAAKSGAIVDGDLWYQDWTLPGTMEFPLGDRFNVEDPSATLTRTPTTDLTSPGSFTLNATATDPDDIAKLEILQDGLVLASATTGAVSFNVVNAQAGTIVYTVRATDKHPYKVRTSTQALSVTVTNLPPVVTIDTASAQNLVQPASFTLKTSATDADGIATLEILEGSTVLSSNTNSGTLNFDLTNVSAGLHKYSVRAKDKSATNPLTATSEMLIFVAPPPANKAPVITSFGRTGETLIANASFTLNAAATDSDGAIASMQILEGNQVLASSASGTISFAVPDKAAGNYSYLLKVTDNHASDPRTVVQVLNVVVFAQPPAENVAGPVINITRTGNDTLMEPASFTLNATADDPNGIDTVQILVNGEVKATGTSLTLSFPISNMVAGTYKYTIKAKDKHATDPKWSSKDFDVVVAANAAPSIVSFSRSGEPNLVGTAAFTMSAVAADLDGIASLQILIGNTVLGTSSNGVLSVQINNLLPGSYTYTVKATDKNSANPKVTTQELKVTVEAVVVSIAIPLRDLSGIRFSSSQGQNLIIESEGIGYVKLVVWNLSGHKVSARNVRLEQGQNAVFMGNLRGLHIVRLTSGKESRSARIVFNPNN